MLKITKFFKIFDKKTKKLKILTLKVKNITALKYHSTKTDFQSGHKLALRIMYKLFKKIEYQKE